MMQTSVEEVNLEGIPPAFHHVVREYGREMFLLVWNTGMATEAVQRLMQLAQKHQSKAGLTDTAAVASAYNQVATLLAQSQGWQQDIVQECDQAIRRAFALSGDTTGSLVKLH